MEITLSWSTYVAVIIPLTIVYYGVVAWMSILRHRLVQVRGRAVAPPLRDLWMDQILETLEETILHAQSKRYHPDEILAELREKIAELKRNANE